MIYMLDTNTVTYIINEPTAVNNFRKAQIDGHDVAVSQIVYFEIVRGYLHKGAVVQEGNFRNSLLPQLTWYTLEDEDWQRAAEYWAQTRSSGK